MPIYEYYCQGCGDQKEVLQKMDDSPPDCEECKFPMTKIVSRTNFSLTGDGWARDGYGGND